jgi:RimJ/RimL family protein N-acetyltransferase
LLSKEAVDSSLDHLRPWMPWALDEPSSLEVIEERIARTARDFAEGREFVYGIFSRDESRMLGCMGLHRRNAETDLELGYWLRVSALGQGFATEAAAALTTAAFASRPDLLTVTIICDPANTRSAAVPARLGYCCQGNFPAKAPTPVRDQDQIWQVTREAWMTAGALR